MDNRCPLCQVNLSRRLVLTKATPGQRKLFPGSATMACPSCGARIQMNTHPIEKRYVSWLSWLTVALSVSTLSQNKFLILGSSALIVIGGGYIAWQTHKHLKTWPRYKPYPNPALNTDAQNAASRRSGRRLAPRLHT